MALRLLCTCQARTVNTSAASQRFNLPISHTRDVTAQWALFKD